MKLVSYTENLKSWNATYMQKKKANDGIPEF